MAFPIYNSNIHIAAAHALSSLPALGGVTQQYSRRQFDVWQAHAAQETKDLGDSVFGGALTQSATCGIEDPGAAG